MVIGHNLKGMGVKDLNVSDFSQALNDVVTGQTCKLTDQEAQQLVNNFIQKQQEEATRAIREEGERFLAENAKKEGVTVLPSGLQYTVITEGTGAQPLATDRVKCHYEGTLTNGQVFDSSANQPGGTVTFSLKNVIKGWSIAIPKMAFGSTWEIYVPYNLAYGEQGTGPIPPYAALVFKVTLVSIAK